MKMQKTLQDCFDLLNIGDVVYLSKDNFNSKWEVIGKVDGDRSFDYDHNPAIIMFQKKGGEYKIIYKVFVPLIVQFNLKNI